MSITQKQPDLFSRRHRRAIILSLMIAAVFYLAIVIYAGYEQTLNAFLQIGFSGWLFLFASSLTSYALRYTRWQYYLGLYQHKLRHGLHFLYYLSAFALTTTPGKAGEIIRSVLLRPHGVPYHTSLACFFIERFLDLVVVAMLALLVLFYFDDYGAFVGIFFGLLLVALPIIRSSLLSHWLSKWQHAHIHSRSGRFAAHLVNLLSHARALVGNRPLYTGILLGLIAWSIQGFAFYFILQTLGFSTSVAIAMGIYAVSLLAGAASFIPGGIGSTELVMGLLLSASGADNSIAITAPLISRLSTLWFAVAIGFVATGSLSLLRNQTE